VNRTSLRDRAIFIPQVFIAGGFVAGLPMGLGMAQSPGRSELIR
jgi:hypothetical protein